MSVNFGEEYNKFKAEQEKLKKYYESLGMSKETIDALYEFDKMQFCENLSFKRRTQYLEVIDEDETTEEYKNPIVKRYLEILAAPFEFHTSDKLWWLQEIGNKKLLRRLLQLSNDELEIITYLVFWDYKQYEYAQMKGVSQSSISQKIGKIKKILSNL